tara:strand:+ start:810 stop:1094 length:285 start_codon:yes stop_codon:yes gene_type:complete
MRKASYYSQIVRILQELHTSYPHYNMGRHLATALDGYGDVWGTADKELLFAIEKYKAQLDMDILHVDENEIDEIVRQGVDLQNILKEEEDNGDY